MDLAVQQTETQHADLDRKGIVVAHPDSVVAQMPTVALAASRDLVCRAPPED